MKQFRSEMSKGAKRMQVQPVYDRRSIGLDHDFLGVGEVETRIMRACKTIRALPDRDRRFLRDGNPSSVAMPVVQDFMDAYSTENEAIIRFRPSPFDVSDVLIALGWCNCLTKDEFRFLWWRSFDQVSFKVIAYRISRSDETARMKYRDALLKVWHVANSQRRRSPVFVR